MIPVTIAATMHRMTLIHNIKALLISSLVLTSTSLNLEEPQESLILLQPEATSFYETILH
jgi:hypothetical protein